MYLVLLINFGPDNISITLDLVHWYSRHFLGYLLANVLSNAAKRQPVRLKN